MNVRTGDFLKMADIILHLPEEMALLLRVPAEEVGHKLQMVAAVKLYELGELSSGAAARLAGVPRTVFLARLADYNVPTFQLSEDDLRREVRLV
jgi:predicted HTH domain antitoxin